MKTANESGWLAKEIEESRNDPGSIAAGLMIDITDNMYFRMQELGVTQKELAKRIGASQPYVSRMLNNGINMSLLTLSKMAVALDLDIEPPVFKRKSRVLHHENLKTNRCYPDAASELFRNPGSDKWTEENDNFEESELNDTIPDAA